MSYNLMEFGGQATVILRAITDFAVNDLEYKKDDVVFLLDGVNLDFSYSEKMSDVQVGQKNKLFYDERHINTITIEEAALTSEYLQLFCVKVENTYTRSHIEKLLITDNEMFLAREITEDEIYIVDHGKYKVSIDKEYNSATLNTEKPFLDGEYTVLYREKLEQNSYDINNNSSIPYLSMEIIGKGNKDKEDGNIYFFVPKVSLLNRPDFSLVGQVTTQVLTFKVIHDTIKVSI